MQYIPTAFKIIINIFFFSVYTLIGIIIENFVFGLVTTQFLWKAVPNAGDPVHMRLAIITIVLVLVLTFFFRKYFYISVLLKNKNTTEEKNKIYTNKSVLEEQKKTNKVVLKDDEIEILIDKEIK